MVDYIRLVSLVIEMVFVFLECICVIVIIGGINIVEVFVSKGLVIVIRYWQDDDQRLLYYDELFVVEVRVIKNGKGLYSKKEVFIYCVVDIFGDI